MKQILETPRLILREFELSDAEKLYELNSDIYVIKFTGDSHFTSILDARKFISEYSDYKKTDLAGGL